jgi:5,10-methylene-tetrahydrofolate dehydrogenase/methenyl tetrahydrofolate cyclohydrolase
VGALTIAMLMHNTIKAAKLRRGLDSSRGLVMEKK